ncbi:hypothetical protein ACUXZZ_20465 [Streptomyces graminifolii]|uniref:hypothetical protein n=1 Tax=Streptomyces graminifolii TaxID=1266771 RepID=UPI00405A2D62
MTNEPATTRGLTIQQPWAFAIAEGFKTVENRTRRTNYRGQLLIHAGLRHDRTVPVVRYSRDAAIRLDELGGSLNFWEARSHLPSRIFAPPHATLALGAVIATARLDGCHEAVDGCCAPWGFPDCWHWELADVRPLQRAVPRNGALGLWKPSPELLASIAPQTVVACGKCKKPFDATDTSFDGQARYRETPYCRSCVDHCHDTEIADHRCVICA